MSIDIFQYDPSDFILSVNKNIGFSNLSKLDCLLQSTWKEAMERGYFWYKLDDLETRILGGKYKFVAQLNIKRAQQRRKPQNMTAVVMPFNTEQFNFTKVKPHEILFSFSRSTHNKSTEQTTASNYIVINVSPLEICNSLLVPRLEDCLPQVLTELGLQCALDFLLLSNTVDLRVGFNSLGGFASVNHHHFHLYYLKHRLYLETAAVTKLAGECYELNDYPAQGFVFQVKDDHQKIIRSVIKLINMFIEESVDHNVLLMRGSSFEENEQPLTYNVVRIYIWARRSSYGVKDEAAFNVALCELGGHLPVKTETAFKTIKEEEVASYLRQFCEETFNLVREKAKSLFNDQ